MNDLAINTNAHTDNGMGVLKLVTLINSYEKASHEQLEQHQTAKNIAYLIGDDNLIYIDDEITVTWGDGAGEIKPTANSIGAVMYDPIGQPANLAIYPLDGSKPFLLNNYYSNECFVIGEGSEYVAVTDLEQAGEFYTSLHDTELEKITIICPFEKWQFDSMVKAHASQSQITLFTDYNAIAKQRKTFKGDNVRLVAIPYPPLTDMLMSDRLEAIINHPESKIEILGGIEWTTPEPLTDDNTPATPYPIKAWTGILKDTVLAIAYHAQVPPAMAGQCVLGALSTIGQRYINAPFGHSHIPASLYLVTEGESGSGKTTASKLSHHSIRQWDRNAYLTFVTLLKEWQADLMSLKGKERADYVKDTPTPKNQTMLITDATIEAVLDKFIIDELANLSWTTDEAGQFFNGHTMKSDTAGNALSSLTKLWSDGEASRLRSQRGKNAIQQTNAYDARLTLDIMGQRVILEPALTDPVMNGQGFLARSLIACPDSLQGSRIYNTPERMNQSPYDDPRLQAYWTRCDILLDPPPDQQPAIDELTGKPKRVNMPFGIGAMQALADYQQTIENRQAKGRALEFLKAFASRMAENATRIATLMAFFDNRQAVEVNDLERAFLLVEYSTAERLRYLDIKTNEKNDSQKLIEWIVKKALDKNTATLNKSFISQNAPNALRGKVLEPLLEGLESMGYIRLETIDRRKLVHINPYLLKK